MIRIVLLWCALLPVILSFSPVTVVADDTTGVHKRQELPVKGYLKSYLSRLDQMDSSASPGRAVINGQLQRFYRAMGYRNAWTNRLAIERLVEVLAGSDADGLLPEDYHFDEIRKYADNPPESPALIARADLLMTDAVFTLLWHMRSGKVNPRSLDDNWNLPAAAPSANSDRMLMDAVMGSKFPEMIASLRPASSRYSLLTKGLSRFRNDAAEGGWIKVPSGAMIQKTGDADPRIPLIRKRLVSSGDLDANAPLGMQRCVAVDSVSVKRAEVDSVKALPQPSVDLPELVYTPEMFEAVKAFQKRYGLSVDGVIGNETVAAMNVPVDMRIAQIRLNLEKQRWYPRTMGGSYILVNIPAFTVDYVRNHEVVWHSRVIVGKPDLQTPVFRAEMQAIILNPQWVIPSGILVKEALPAIMKNMKYLAKNQLTVVGEDGKPVDPHAVNWAQYQTGGFPYRLVQDSGDDGSLGRIKFLLPNRFTVYMHDTPSKRLFEKSQRAFSHGCVRVDRPFELAEIVLQNPVKWNMKKIEEAVATEKTRTVSLPEKVPVYFTYQTAFADGDQVQFRADIYNRDGRLHEALDNRKESRMVEDAAH
jgi:murein L,D-transpeptidase YcbB/YkuD